MAELLGKLSLKTTSRKKRSFEADESGSEKVTLRKAANRLRTTERKSKTMSKLFGNNAKRPISIAIKEDPLPPPPLPEKSLEFKRLQLNRLLDGLIQPKKKAMSKKKIMELIRKLETDQLIDSATKVPKGPLYKEPLYD